MNSSLSVVLMMCVVMRISSGVLRFDILCRKFWFVEVSRNSGVSSVVIRRYVIVPVCMLLLLFINVVSGFVVVLIRMSIVRLMSVVSYSVWLLSVVVLWLCLVLCRCVICVVVL